MPKGAARPNILIFYVDQLRFDAIGCAGNDVIKTPHIDRLANEGVRFDKAYVSFPLCCPFRASFFTGKYAHSHGLVANHYPVPLGQKFLPEMMRDSGYRTGYFGKWHLDGGPKYSFVPPGERRLGFETFVGFNRGHQYFGSIFYRDSEQPITSKRYEPDFQTDHLLDFIEKGDDRPFFAEICLSPPHPPLVAPDHFLDLYSPDEVPLRKNVPWDDEAREKARNFLAKYYGLTAAVDHDIGKVLDRLDAKEMADDTLVIFMSDHGEMAGEHGLYNKKTYHEAAMRVPFIVRYPERFPGGFVVNSMIDPSVDTMPTLLELCGLETPEEVEGTSFLPLLEVEASETREAVFYEVCMEREGPERFPVPERGVRTADWLYARTEERPKALFDLRADPLETNNLVSSLEHRPVRDRLDAKLREHMRETNDDWKAEAVFPPPDFVTHEEGQRDWKRLLERAVVEA